MRLLLLLMLLSFSLSPCAQTKKIKGLKTEQQRVKKEIDSQQKKLRSNELDVQKRLQNLMVINADIEQKRDDIASIRKEINALESEIKALNRQIADLNKQLDDKKEKYVKSMRYMHRNRSVQSRLMFIFSAKNFSQMYRRMRFMREYAAYQQSQGEEIKQKQAEVEEKSRQVAAAKDQKSSLLARGEEEKKALETKQKEQEQTVASLRKQQKTIKSVIAQQKERDAALNAEIDRLVEIEVEKARMRAAEEARKKAEAERLAAGKKDKKKSEAVASAPSVASTSADDRVLSGSFESNKGKLPMPLAGSCRIVNHYGQYNVEGLANVRLENKGINIMGSSGAQVRSIFDGEVSAVFNMGGIIGVMVRHGSYISVYCNLSSVSVRKGQKVITRQTLGTVGNDNILQFQLRKERDKLNPELWLAR